MDFTASTVLDGTVKTIAAFGAFISLPEGKTGLVHISEVANTYVRDIREFLAEGQAVRVRVIGVDANGRISLSIKQAQERVERPQRTQRTERANFALTKLSAPADSSFEDKLKRFMADSDDKISGVRQYEHKTRVRKR